MQKMALEGHKTKWTSWWPPGRETELMKARDGKEVFQRLTFLDILNFDSHECTTYSKHMDIHTNINKYITFNSLYDEC